MSSFQRKYKAFSSCVSHLSVVSLFYCIGLGVCLCSVVSKTSQPSARASVMHTVFTPMLNPFIYSLSNKDIKRVLGRPFEKQTVREPTVLRLQECSRLQGSYSQCQTWESLIRWWKKKFLLLCYYGVFISLISASICNSNTQLTFFPFHLSMISNHLYFVIFNFLNQL
jgi:hypothetical protein